ncbi:MAG: protein kinase, partial [Thermoanaerobaculia bacterium]
MATMAGRMLGRYRLESLLGQGGMAQVYKAADSKLGRVVAVKVILPAHASDAHFMERFLREARVVASLEHPNILPIYDFGEDDGSAFLVMPFLEGGTLRDRMLGRPIPLGQAASWIRQLGEALDAAHEAGILHRDVKPANVLIGKGDRLVLADFGIAKMLESLAGLTATGVVVGTPIYMAPEQAQGRPASPASDRYALAVLAYELLSGRPPFDGESALALMNQHVTMVPPALSTKIGGLPSGLDTLFARALAKEPSDRPGSCRAISDSIGEYLPAGSQTMSDVATASWAPAGSGPRLAAPSSEAIPEPTAPTAPTVLAGPTRPANAFSVSGSAPGLTSEVTILQARSSAGLRRLSIPALAAAILVLAGVFAWRSSPTRVVPTLPVSPVVPPHAPAAPETEAPDPPDEDEHPSPPPPLIVELPVATSVPAQTKSKEAPLKSGGERLELLASAVDDCIAKGKLLPPDTPNAIESIGALRREFPAARQVLIAERRLADALKREAQRHAKAGEFADAKSDLKSAQLLAPGDADLAAHLREADLALSQAAAGATRREPGEPAASEPADG